MLPRILICGDIVWTHDELKQLFENIAEVIPMKSMNRKEFLDGFASGGQYEGVVGIFRRNRSADYIGIFDKQVIDGIAHSVKWISHNGAGYDQIDVQACKAHGIAVSHTPGAVDDSTATTAFYLILSTVRQFSQGERSLRAGTWKPTTIAAAAHDLTGLTIAILGLGGIGRRLAELVHAFPMRVVYHSRRKVENAPAWCQYFSDLEEMLAQTDVLSIHLPLNAETQGFVSERVIRALKRGAVIVNTARGKIIDEDALIQALEDGHISSAGLDVYPNEPKVNPRLLDFPQVTLLPHMGTSNQDTQHKMEARALRNLRDFLTSGTSADLVQELL